MAKDKVIPADIQADADKKHPNTGYKDEIYCDIWHRDRGIYIQGRLDEKAKTVNDAVEFADWCEDNYWPTSQVGKWWSDPISDEIMLTTHQLYCIWQVTKTQ